MFEVLLSETTSFPAVESLRLEDRMQIHRQPSYLQIESSLLDKADDGQLGSIPWK
jgi:hypothetical protein